MGITAIPMPVIVGSGAHVVGDFTAEIASGTIIVPEVEISSGLHIQISGQYVYVASGVHVVSESGSLHTFIDGGMIEVESGLHVVIESGIGVIGDFTTEVASGLHVVVGSGIHVVSEVEVSSGLHIQISGQYVYVASGVHVVGDFTVGSGLGVTQSKEIQLQNYFISDTDESDEGIKFYGYLGAEGGWYIMRSTSGTTYRYASSGIYTSNWVNRSGIDYQAFDQEF